MAHELRAHIYAALAGVSLCASPPAVDPRTAVDRIVIHKSERTLTVLSSGRAVTAYRVALGRVPRGRKTQAGDLRTPEGHYFIDAKNASSHFYRALHLSYPSAGDIARAKANGVSAGGDIMVHGL